MPVANRGGKIIGFGAKEVGEALRKTIALGLRDMAVECKANLVEATPKLTSFAASNWRLAVDKVPAGVIGTPPKTKTKKGTVRRFTGGGDGGLSTVLRYKLTDGIIFCYNNVPYINRLNNGWSKKAPIAFIEAAIERAIATGERAFARSGASVR